MSIKGPVKADAQNKPVRPRSRREDPEVRRQELLRATVTCLARLGPHGATGREICRQAGVSHSLLRHYFGNPQTLLLEAYEQLSESFVKDLELQLRSSSEVDPWSALRILLEHHFSDEWAGSDVLGAWIAFWTLVRADEAFAGAHRNFNRRLNALIEQALPMGAPTADGLGLTDAAAVIAGVMDGLWLEFGLSPTAMTRSRAIELCLQTAKRITGKLPTRQQRRGSGGKVGRTGPAPAA